MSSVGSQQHETSPWRDAEDDQPQLPDVPGTVVAYPAPSDDDQADAIADLATLPQSLADADAQRPMTAEWLADSKAHAEAAEQQEQEPSALRPRRPTLADYVLLGGW